MKAEDKSLAKFKVIETDSSGDFEFEAEAETLEQLFEICGVALFESMTDTKKVKHDKKIEFNLEEESTEELLYAYLAELIYIYDVESVLLSKFDVIFDGENKLSCRAWGETINHEKHDLRTEAKAVTYHKFKLEKTESGYIAHAILDL